MGEVSLLQNEHGVQDMPVEEVYLHHRPHHRSAQAYLHWAVLMASIGREVHLICLWPVPCGWGYSTPSRVCHLSMLSHHSTRHISCRHLLPALPAVKPSLLALPVGGDLPHHPSPVRRLRLIYRSLAGVADHADCLSEIVPQAHPIKQANKGTKCTLEPAGV